MQKNWWKIVSASTVVIVALAMATGMAIAQPEDNLLQNPGFEEGKTGWVPRTAEECGPNHVIDTAVKHSGAQSGRVDKSGYYYSKRFEAPEGAWLHATFWGKVTEGDTGRGMMYFWQGKKLLSSHTGPTVRGDEWKEYEFYVRVPEGTQQVMLGLTFRGKGSAWYDDAAVTVSKDAQGGAPVPNLGFEGGIAPWKPRTKVGFTENHRIDTEIKHGGKQSASIKSPGGYYYSPKFPLPANAKLTVRYWAKVQGTSRASSAIYLWRGKKPERIQGPKPSGDEWKQYSFSATIPDGVDNVMIALEYFSKTEGNAWYDDVELKVEE